jgi:hypothetical protein
MRLALAALALLAALPAAAELRAGFAKADITPKKAVPLAGYGARKGKLSAGVHDPVFARAAVFSADGRKAAILSADMVGVSGEVRKLLADGVCSDLGISSEHFLLCATHNHSGPGGLSKNPLIRIAAGRYDQELFDEVVGKLAEALRAADAALAPATLRAGRATFEGLARNRAADGGPTDPAGIVVRVDGPDGAARAVFVNFAAHPTILGADNFEISADWPGAMCGELERRFPGCEAFFLNGAQGDQAPRSPGGETPWEKVAAMGKRAAEIAAEALDKAGACDARVEGRLLETDLPPLPFQGEWPTRSLLQIFDLGSARFFCFPGEPCLAVGKAATALETREGVLAGVVCCANDHLGYFVPPDYYFGGGYESTLNFLGPRVQDWFAAKFGELLGAAPPPPPAPDVRVTDHAGFKAVVVRGDPYTAGLGHGRALKAEIVKHSEFWRAQITAMAGALPVRQLLPIPDDVDPAPLLFPVLAVRCRLLLRECEPALLDELRGIADGAGVAFDEIVFLNTWMSVADQTDPTALFRLKPGCATATAGKWLAHNSDWPPQKDFPSVAALVCVVPKEGRPVAMMTFAGCAGAPLAMSADGAAIAIDSMPAPDDTGLEGLPVWLAARTALQFNRIASEIAEAIELSPGTAGYLVTIRDPEETIRLQVSAQHAERDPAEPRGAPKHDKKRRKAVEDWLEDHPEPKGRELRELFSTKEFGVVAPCTRHSVVMDVERRKWWVAIGPGKEIGPDRYQEVEVGRLLAR